MSIISAKSRTTCSRSIMDNHLMSSFTILLLSSFAATVAYPARNELQPNQMKNHHSSVSSYNPQPKDFPTEQLYRAYLIIQRFKNTIISDPKNVTATWIGHDLCGETTYVGFYCGSPAGGDKKLTVTGVILNGYNLHAPTLEGFVNQLPDLALFHAASNNFGGDIPQLTGLGYMYELSVAVKDLQLQARPKRDIPPDSTVGLGGNTHGHGHLGFTDAKALLLNHNNLSGPLPSNLGFSKLSYLALANNKLTGPIPPSISNLEDSLFELTGPIPSSFSCLISVEQLNLAGNRLYGQVPDALCKLAGPAGRLANLTLSGNYFTSAGPACAALIKDGVLDVKNNCIPGLTNQRRPAECAAFQSQPKTCPAASTQVTCPAAAASRNAAAPGERKVKDYSSYVTYATLHD
uniref:Leucine-rich repeat (LRR) family protein n=1 Tax=Zea mays TaxID=4577 RepID=A0A804NTE1_MAIZE